MKKWLIMICSMGFLSSEVGAQDVQAAFTLDSRSGYTTNPFLNPYLSEWDRSGNTGYISITPIGQFAISGNRFSSDLTAGGVYNPFFDDRSDWSGAFSMANVRYRLNDRLSIGLEGGGSYFSTQYERQLYWVQPVLNWSLGTFTQLRVRAGSTFRKLDGEMLEEDGSFSRFDNYSLELETWRGFQWQFRGSLYGDLNDPIGNIGLRTSLNYWQSASWQFSVQAGLEQFQYTVLTDTGGGNGGPPFGGPAPGGEEVSDEADRIFRVGAGATYRINSNLALTANADLMNYFSTAMEEAPVDLHFSAGVRYNFSPRLGRSRGATTEWKQNDSQVVLLRLNYSGDGQLYIIGDFNDWEQPGVPLSRQERNRYVAELSLEPGAYEYKILLIEGEEKRWIDFSDDTYTVLDGFGGENGLIFID